MTTLKFLREQVPKRWIEFRDSVTDNFRIIDPADFRVLERTRYSFVKPAAPGS